MSELPPAPQIVLPAGPVDGARAAGEAQAPVKAKVKPAEAQRKTIYSTQFGLVKDGYGQQPGSYRGTYG